MGGSQPAQKIRPAETDERLVIEAAQRDRAQFIELYDRYFEVVYAYAARRMHERPAAEDVTSEVFRKALENLPRFKWTGAPFGAWLLRIASNVIADRAKRDARERSVSPRVSKGVHASSLAEELPPNSEANSPQRQQSDLEECERRAHLFKLVHQLAEDQRRVVMMRFGEEKSIGEIAKQLGRSDGAIKQLQFRAIKNLRNKLEQSNKQ